MLDRILEYARGHTEDWQNGGWRFEVVSPPELERQLDAWSCGLFVMMAMQVFAAGLGGQAPGETEKEGMRAGALQALLERPPITLYVKIRSDIDLHS